MLQTRSVSVKVPITLTLLHRVDEVREDVLLIHWNLLEMLADNFSKLRLVETGTCTDFVVFFVATKCLHLQ